MDKELKTMFRKDIAAEQGKTRYKDINSTVMQRLPKIYADTYLLK